MDEIKWMELLDKFRSVQERARRQTLQYSNKVPGPNTNGNGIGSISATFTPPRVPTPSGGTAGNAPGAGGSKGRGGLGIGRLAGGRKAVGRGK